MIDAKTVEELRGLLAADTSTDWQTIRADPAEGADVWWICAKNAAGQEVELGSLQGGFPHPTREARARLIVAMRNALPALLDLAASLAREGEDGELCKRLRYNASIWQRKADDDHPLVKDQLDAANAIDRLAYQAQGHCRDAKHAESVADELRRLLEKEKERADKFMWQVRDTCARAEKAEARIRALAFEKEGLRKALEGVLAAVANITKIDAATGKNLCELPLDSDEVLEAWDALNAALRRARSELESGHE